MEEYPNIKKIELHKLENLTDSERNDNKNYETILKDNLEKIKQELYQ